MSELKITGYSVHGESMTTSRNTANETDVRYPTNVTGDGTDAM